MFTTEGIITGIIFAILVGGFFGMVIWSSNLHIIEKVWLQILVCGIIFLICSIGVSTEDKNWNNGYCVECETKYECVGKSKTTNEYYYSCPNCFYKTNH